MTSWDCSSDYRVPPIWNHEPTSPTDKHLGNPNIGKVVVDTTGLNLTTDQLKKLNDYWIRWIRIASSASSSELAGRLTMGYSDMDYRDKSFQAHDADLAVWMHYVVEAIDRAQDRPRWLDELRQNWHDQATGGFGFGIMPELDKHFADDARKATILPLFRQALAEMDRHGDMMRVDELNSLKPSGPNAVFAEDLPMERFRKVGRRAIDLLEGRPPES